MKTIEKKDLADPGKVLNIVMGEDTFINAVMKRGLSPENIAVRKYISVSRRHLRGLKIEKSGLVAI